MFPDIAELLMKHGAVAVSSKKTFTWASGIVSPVYCDHRVLLSCPKARDELVGSFILLMKQEKISCDVIAGVATAGIPHATILADRLKLPLVYVRSCAKGHGKQNRIEGSLKKGQRVLVVEDLVSTGGSSLDVVLALRRAGAKVGHCLSIFSYGFSGTGKKFEQAQCRLHSLVQMGDLFPLLSTRKQNLVKKFLANPTGWEK